ncbi:MAG: HAD hydrolase-like protein [Planctomycetota bacterium]
MKRTLALVDIDGTLILSGGAGGRAIDRAGRELFGSEFSWEGVDPAGAMDPYLFHEAARRSGVDVGAGDEDRFKECYFEFLREELVETGHLMQVLPGVHQFLARLFESASVIPALLTGNYSVSARLKLECAGIDFSKFRIGAFGDDAETRPELVPVAQERHRALSGDEIAPEDIVIVGDTPKDVGCGKDNGCRVIAVATGSFSFEQLMETEADLVVPHLEDERVWPFLERRG